MKIPSLIMDMQLGFERLGSSVVGIVGFIKLLPLFMTISSHVALTYGVLFTTPDT